MTLQGVRSQFPALKQQVNGHDLIYFDSAATTLKPQSVVDRLTHFYAFESANVHRGAHFLSDRATENYEHVRQTVAEFIQCEPDEVIFTQGTTASINLVAHSFGEVAVKPGDEVLISELEHHGNIVSWQILCEKTGAQLKVIKINDLGEIDLEDYRQKLNDKTKIVSISGCSNTLGTIPDLAMMIPAAHAVGAVVVVDAAQLVTQRPIRCHDLKIDFLAFSGHKIFGPTGVGVLMARRQHQIRMRPYQTGGSMIKEVTFAHTTYQEGPLKFEAGTPHIAGVIGMGTAIDFFKQFSFQEIRVHEERLRVELENFLKQQNDVRVFGQSLNKGAITSFAVNGVHHSDLAVLLDQQGIAVRAGHLCTQPLLARFQTSGFLRVSFSLYNTVQEVQKFQAALVKSIQLLKGG